MAKRSRIHQHFEEAMEGEEVERKEKLKTKWAQFEAVVRTDKRLKIPEQDIIEHLEKRREAMDGKAMAVCMSWHICIKLYRELVETVRSNVTIDWTPRENVLAHLYMLVKRSLHKHRHPPDKRKKTMQTVLEQAEVLWAEWAAA